MGQTGKHVADRMRQHTGDGTITTHNQLAGHVMDLMNPTKVYNSDCYYTRITVEVALIHAAPTVPHNTASGSIASNDLVAPVICRATKFNWEKLSNCIPQLKEDAIPKQKRYLFGDQPIVRAPISIRSQPLPTPVAHNTRSRARPQATNGDV